MKKNLEIRIIEPFLLNRKEAAKFLGVGLNTLIALDIPRTQIRKRVLYRKDLLEKWAIENTKKKNNKGEVSI